MDLYRYIDNSYALLDKLTSLGPERSTPSAQLAKLREEADEVAEALARGAIDEVLLELVDVVIVCTIMSLACGSTIEEQLERLERKAEINRLRQWYPTQSGTARHTKEES